MDQPFINNFRMQQVILEKRLLAMTHQLAEPYRRARLPVLLHPVELIT